MTAKAGIILNSAGSPPMISVPGNGGSSSETRDCSRGEEKLKMSM